MSHIAEYGAKLLSHLAVAADKLSLGLLMAPEEVARTVAHHQPDAVSGRWWLCGNMHRRMFSAAQQQPLRHLGRCIVTAEGTRYLVLAQQTGTWQHRLLLQVAGQQVTDFLAASVLAGFDLSLGLTGGDESLLVVDCRFVQPLLGSFDAQGCAIPRLSAHRLRQEACRVATDLLSPSAVTVNELPVPDQVCVSIVASCELVAAVMPEVSPES